MRSGKHSCSRGRTKSLDIVWNFWVDLFFWYFLDRLIFVLTREPFVVARVDWRGLTDGSLAFEKVILTILISRFETITYPKYNTMTVYCWKRCSKQKSTKLNHWHLLLFRQSKFPFLIQDRFFCVAACPWPCPVRRTAAKLAHIPCHARLASYCIYLLLRPHKEWPCKIQSFTRPLCGLSGDFTA